MKNIINNIDKNIKAMEKWCVQQEKNKITKILKNAKREIIKNLNESGFNEAYAKCVVRLVFEKYINREGL